MGFLSKFTKLSRSKGFDYQPRYYKSDKEGNPFKIEYKFDQFRTTAGSNRGLKNKVNNILEDSRKQSDRKTRMRLLIIIAILVLIFLYIIDFDFTIFYSS
jgi:hypothetical protein